MTCSRLLVKDLEQRPGTWLKLITKTLSKSLWHDANLVRHTNSFLNASDTKCLESATREVYTVPQITASISRIPTRDKSLSKTLSKSYSFKLVIFSNLVNSTDKRLEQHEGVHGYLSWWLRTSLWQRDRSQRHFIASVVINGKKWIAELVSQVPERRFSLASLVIFVYDLGRVNYPFCISSNIIYLLFGTILRAVSVTLFSSELISSLFIPIAWNYPSCLVGFCVAKALFVYLREY